MGFYSGANSGNSNRGRAVTQTSPGEAAGSNVLLTRSRLSAVILRGGLHHQRSLQRQIQLLRRNERLETRAIALRQRQIAQRRYVNMSRSQKLVDMYDLPPLKTPVKTSVGTAYVKQRLSSPTSTPHTDFGAMNAFDVKATKTPLSGRREKPKKHTIPKQTDLNGSAEDLRNLMYTPIPQKNADGLSGNTRLTNSRVTRESPSRDGQFPEITVEPCEEFLPPIHRKNTPLVPDYASSYYRSESSHSLSVPSPVLRQKARDGKMVISTNLDRCFSRSEGCIPDNVQQLDGLTLKSDELNQHRKGTSRKSRFQAIDAALQPLAPPRPLSVGNTFGSDDSICSSPRRERSLTPLYRKSMSHT